jgi:hypothetical protein
VANGHPQIECGVVRTGEVSDIFEKFRNSWLSGDTTEKPDMKCDKITQRTDWPVIRNGGNTVAVNIHQQMFPGWNKEVQVNTGDTAFVATAPGYVCKRCAKFRKGRR